MATGLERPAGVRGDLYLDPAITPRRHENGGGRSVPGATEDRNERLTRALGWFSIGLGLAEVVAPVKLGRAIGVTNRPAVFRLLGLREIASGVAILRQPSAAGGVWSRLVGDLLDMALLGTQLDSNNSERRRTVTATVAVVGVTALDWYALHRLSQGSTSATSPTRGLRVRQSITINRPLAEVYDFCHDLQNLPRFMTHLESVAILGPRRSHWIASGPKGTTVEWDAEMVEDRRNELISWSSFPGGDVETSGSVRFKPAPANRGTEIVVEMRYDPPGGLIGATLAKLFGEGPDQIVSRDLRALKNVLELGEVVHSDASIHRGPHPARPPRNTRDANGHRPGLGQAAAAGKI